MVLFRFVVVLLLVLNGSGLSAQTVRFPNEVPPLGKRTFSYSSRSIVSSVLNPEVMDSNYLANAACVESFDFHERSGMARLLHVTILGEKKSTTSRGGVGYVHGPVVGRDYFIQRSDTSRCIIYHKAGVELLESEKSYMTDEYSKYLWDEVMWGIVKGRTLEMGVKYELQPSDVGRFPLRSKIDTLKGSLILVVVEYEDDDGYAPAIELSLSYNTVGESAMLQSTGQHVMKMIIERKSWRLLRLKEEYVKENYAKEIMTEYFTQVIREVVVSWKDS
jgi:hypothetical protein